MMNGIVWSEAVIIMSVVVTVLVGLVCIAHNILRRVEI